MRADDLDRAVENTVERLAAFPYLGSPAWIRMAWSKTIRRIIVGDTGHLLHYRVLEDRGMILVLRLCHERQRPPKP